jgi:hypothetical protein
MPITEATKQELAWWVEIVTVKPSCIYYFGPFASAHEAELAQPGYVEDLVREEAQDILVQIKQCKPKNLTIVLEDDFRRDNIIHSYQYYLSGR